MIDEAEKPGRCAAGHIHRRSAVRSIALGGVALFVLAGLPETASAMTGETLTQEGWRRCRRCQILFFSLDRTGGLGVCPAGGAHESSDDFYLLRMGPEIAGVQLGGWSWCMHCMALFDRVGGNMGACPSPRSLPERRHVNYSGAYAAVLEDGGHDRQPDWRWCSKCMGMFYDGGDGGICPRDHDHHEGAASRFYAQLTDPSHKS